MSLLNCRRNLPRPPGGGVGGLLPRLCCGCEAAEELGAEDSSMLVVQTKGKPSASAEEPVASEDMAS